MLNRTFLVKMPSNASTMPYLDILPGGPVGSPSAPVKIAAGGTTPPSGWQVFAGPVSGDGQFCEWRSLILRTPILFGATGFVPRFRLGWHTSIYLADTASTAVATPSVVHSQSLVGALVSPFDVETVADPSYGPSIRLMNAATVQGKTYVVHVLVAEAKDDQRSPTGV